MSEIATIDAGPSDDGQGVSDNLPDVLDVVDAEIVDDGGDTQDVVDGEVLGDGPAPAAQAGVEPVPPTRPVPAGGGGGGGVKLGGSRHPTSTLAALLALLLDLVRRLGAALTGQRGQDKAADAGQWTGPVAWMSAEWRAARTGQGQARGQVTGQARPRTAGQRTGQGAVGRQDKHLSRTGQRTAGQTVARQDRTGQDPSGAWWM